MISLNKSVAILLFGLQYFSNETGISTNQDQMKATKYFYSKRSVDYDNSIQVARLILK